MFSSIIFLLLDRSSAAFVHKDHANFSKNSLLTSPGAFGAHFEILVLSFWSWDPARLLTFNDFNISYKNKFEIVYWARNYIKVYKLALLNWDLFAIFAKILCAEWQLPKHLLHSWLVNSFRSSQLCGPSGPSCCPPTHSRWRCPRTSPTSWSGSREHRHLHVLTPLPELWILKKE